MSETLVDWSSTFYRSPELVAGRTVHCAVDAPLPAVAFLERVGVAGVQFTGELAAAHAAILWDEIASWRTSADGGAGPPLGEELLANACTADGFKRAAELGSVGLGLVRGEFLFAVGVAALVDQQFTGGGTVADALTSDGEWRTLCRLLADQRLRRMLAEQLMFILDAADSAFPPSAPVFVRCFDYGDAYSGTGGGLRGAALLLDQLPEAVVFLANIVAEAQARHAVRYVFAMPMVATYAELTETVALAGRGGVTFAASPDDLTRPGFGWEVETPAACLCTGLWSDHLEREYGIVPALCGIGTNDLTQFTLARPRRMPVRLVDARHEAHPAVLALLGTLADDCTGRGISAVLSGAAGEDPGYRAFARQLGFLVSCPIPALMTVAHDRLTPVLTQAVAADRLVDAYGVADAIGRGTRH